jgi:hypothetical protein
LIGVLTNFLIISSLAIAEPNDDTATARRLAHRQRLLPRAVHQARRFVAIYARISKSIRKIAASAEINAPTDKPALTAHVPALTSVQM